MSMINRSILPIIIGWEAAAVETSSKGQRGQGNLPVQYAIGLYTGTGTFDFLVLYCTDLYPGLFTRVSTLFLRRRRTNSKHLLALPLYVSSLLTEEMLCAWKHHRDIPV